MSHKIIDHEQIRLLAADGLTAPEIATETGYCVGAVRKYAKKYDVSITPGQIGRAPGYKPKPKPPASLPKSTVAAVIAPKQSAASKKIQHVLNVADEMQIIRGIADDAGIPSRPCESRKPSVVEALELKIRLPWFGKVQQQTPADLAPDLYDALIGYANFSAEDLAKVFGFSNEGFRVWLKKYGYPVRESAAAEPVEHDLTIKPRAGQTFAGRKKEMDQEAVFRAHDFAADTFTPEDDAPIPYTMDLRDCAARLLDAIDKMDAAVADVKKYQEIIRRLA